MTTLKLVNFYDFRSWRDVIRYKTRLQDALHSTGSTRLPTVIVTRSVRVGPTSYDVNCASDSMTLHQRSLK